MNRGAAVLAGLVMLAMGTETRVCAADHMNLQEGLPLQVEDAYPIAYRGRELQGVFRYDLTREEEDQVLLEPQLEMGILPNTELRIRSPFYLGDADQTGRGNIDIAGLYNFNTESIYVPALALEGEGTVPTGVSSDGFDTAVKFIATKSIGTGSDRIHLNAAWLHNAAPREDERENRYKAILGYSRRLAADWVGVADFVRETEREKNKDSNMFEAGVRWQLTPRTVVSFGVGAGIGRESPDVRGIFGIQRSF